LVGLAQRVGYLNDPTLAHPHVRIGVFEPSSLFNGYPLARNTAFAYPMQ
jgi:hypothetical protein